MVIFLIFWWIKSECLRESIAETAGYILKWFEIDLDVEDAIGAQDW